MIGLFQKRWDGLLRRALCRASGQEPPTRGKRWKSRQAQINADKQEKAEEQNNAGVRQDIEDQNNTDKEVNNGPPNVENVQENTEKNLDDNLRFVTQFVDESTDIDQMIIENFTDSTFVEQLSAGKELTTNLAIPDALKYDLATRKRHFDGKSSTENERQFGIVGLHTCGPLASSSLKIFLAKDAARYFFKINAHIYRIQIRPVSNRTYLNNGLVRYFDHRHV